MKRKREAFWFTKIGRRVARRATREVTRLLSDWENGEAGDHTSSQQEIGAQSGHQLRLPLEGTLNISDSMPGITTPQLLCDDIQR